MTGGRLVGLRGDEEQLASELDERLRRTVARRVRASPETIEDACQHAWQAFLHAQPDRGPWLLSWLTTTAAREAWRLHAHERLEVLAGGDGHDDPAGSWEAAIASRDDVAQAVQARQALTVLAALPERQRRYLTWKVAGLSREEIARADGDVTLTAVNRHLTRARAGVRSRRDQAA